MEGRFHIPVESLLPYMQAIFQNLQSDFKNSLTGPLERGDQKVIDRHQEILRDDPFSPVYSGFVKTFQLLKEQNQ